MRLRRFHGLLFATLAGVVLGDMYLHSPRGSNDRNCERNVNRDNANRLFDSQNNAAGGYACPRAVGDDTVQPESGQAVIGSYTQNKRMYYYEGSILPIEWTNQHGCGPNSITDCQVILQYACSDTLDPKIDNFFPYTTGKNPTTPDTYGSKHFQYKTEVAAPRDGVPTDSNDAATDTIDDTEEDAIPDTEDTRRYGMHESYDYYELCQQTERNKGLYTADQAVHRNDERGTRQNPNGNRQGLECPEEREYYPWWQPSPWVDIAVMTNEAEETACTSSDTCTNAPCTWYLSNSFNTNDKCYCDSSHSDSTSASVDLKFDSTAWNNNEWYNNEAACTAAGFYWYCVSLADQLTGLSAPVCVQTQYSRVNHLGNTISATDSSGISQVEATNIITSSVKSAVLAAIPQSAEPNRFLWQIPTIPTASSSWSDDMETDYASCVVRARYNISTGDFPVWPDEALAAGDPNIGKMVTYLNNSLYEGDPRTPLSQDPYVYIGPASDDADAEDAFLSLAVNTNQYGRTFQDRTYVFSIKPTPTTDSAYDAGADAPIVLGTTLQDDLKNGGIIYNMGVRGKRGNIVQVYPAVEYNFIPDELIVQTSDWVHFQWTGSDYNPQRGCNDAEGGPPDPNNYVSSENDDNARADRSNICLVMGESYNQPRDYAGYSQAAYADASLSTKRSIAEATIVPYSFCDDSSINEDDCYDMLMRLCFLNQEEDEGSLYLRSNLPCLTEDELDAITDENEREQNPLNCAKLNAKPYPYLDGGLVPMKKPGIYPFFGSRNNNFSNRNQPGIICVNGGSVDCLDTYYNSDLRTLQDNSEYSGENAEKSASYCQDSANSADGSNSNGASSCIGDGSYTEILQGESFSVSQGDNDATGDGDKKACQSSSVLNNTSLDEDIGLAVGLLFVGLFTSWFGYYLYNRYKVAHPGESIFKGKKAWQKKDRQDDML